MTTKGTTMRILIFAIAFLALALPAKADEATVELQQRLNEQGCHVPVTGNYGPMTGEAVACFQRKHDLEPDGVAGPVTLSVLFAQPRHEVEEEPEERKAPAVVERRLSDQEEFARCGDELIEQSAERLGKSRALTGARKSWESKVYSTEGLGIRYGDWNNATDKSEQCFPASAGSRWTWNCTVKGRPCKAGN
jgi:hypothetical protein